MSHTITRPHAPHLGLLPLEHTHGSRYTQISVCWLTQLAKLKHSVLITLNNAHSIRCYIRLLDTMTCYVHLRYVQVTRIHTVFCKYSVELPALSVLHVLCHPVQIALLDHPYLLLTESVTIRNCLSSARLSLKAPLITSLYLQT